MMDPFDWAGERRASESGSDGKAMSATATLPVVVHCFCGASQVGRSAACVAEALGAHLQGLDPVAHQRKSQQSLEGFPESRQCFEGLL